MRTKFPSSTTPGRAIYLTITDYNLSGDKKSRNKQNPTKKCRKCGRELPLLEFLVLENKRVIKGVTFACLEESMGMCRDCHPARTNFYLYRDASGGLKMRIWGLRYSSRQPVLLFNPTVRNGGPSRIKKGWERIRERGIRLMDGTDNEIALQPQSNRSISLKAGQARRRPVAGRAPAQSAGQPTPIRTGGCSSAVFLAGEEEVLRSSYSGEDRDIVGSIVFDVLKMLGIRINPETLPLSTVREVGTGVIALLRFSKIL